MPGSRASQPVEGPALKQFRDEAYVLRAQPLGEADLIVSFLTQSSGKVRGVASAARKSRRRFGGALEPLTHLRLEWTEREGRELHRLDGVEGIRSFAEMQGDPVLQAACAVLAELSEAFAREGEADPKSFDLLGAVLEALELGTDPWLALRYFEYWLARLHGVLPELGSCAVCGGGIAGRAPAWVDPGVGLRCRTCAGPPGATARRIRAGERAFFEVARRTPPTRLTFDARMAQPGGALEALLKGTLESFVERRFRTYRHLRSLTLPETRERRTG